MGLLDAVKKFRKEANKNAISATAPAPLPYATQIQRRGILLTYISNVLGEGGLRPLFDPDTDDEKAGAREVRRANTSWDRMKCNNFGADPWSLQCQALVSLVEYSCYFMWRPTDTAAIYILSTGKRTDTDRKLEAAEAAKNPEGINDNWYFGSTNDTDGRKYPRSEVTLVEIPTLLNGLVNAEPMIDLLKGFAEAHGNAYKAYTDLMGLMATLFAEDDIEDVFNDENAAAQRLSGRRIIRIPSHVSKPEQLAANSDAPGLTVINEIMVEFKSQITALSNLANSHNYKNVNYTSGIMANQQDEKIYRIHQQRLSVLRDAIYENWGDLNAKLIFDGWSDYHVAPLDPSKFAMSRDKLVAMGAISVQSVTREFGKEPWKIRVEKRQEGSNNAPV